MCCTSDHLFSRLPLPVFQNAGIKLEVMNQAGGWKVGSRVLRIAQVKYDNSITLKKEELGAAALVRVCRVRMFSTKN